MIFCVERETEETLPFDEEALGCRVAQAVLDQEGCPFEAEICLLLTDHAGIRELNRMHRKTDAETDVLSFPALLFEQPAAFDTVRPDVPGTADPDTGAVWLGDIALNVARVREQALKYGHSAEREFAFLIAHSVLHLTGHDHMEEAEASEMEKRQERVLKTLGITRDGNGNGRTE